MLEEIASKTVHKDKTLISKGKLSGFHNLIIPCSGNSMFRLKLLHGTALDEKLNVS